MENIEGRGTSLFGRGTDAIWKEDLSEARNMDMPSIPFQLKSAGDKNFNITPEETKMAGLGTRRRFGRHNWKDQFGQYDLSQVDEFNRPDFENDSGTVLRAKLDNLRRLGTPKKLGTGRYGRFDYKAEFDQYDLTNVDESNRPDFENDSGTVLRAKLDNLKRLGVPLKKLGTGHYGRFDYKAEFDQYDLSQVDEFNKPDFDNDSGTVLRAKFENLRRLGVPLKKQAFGTGRFGRSFAFQPPTSRKVGQTPVDDSRYIPTVLAKADNEIDNIPKEQLSSAARSIDWAQVPEYNHISPDDSIMTQRAKIKAAMKQKGGQYGRATINYKAEFDKYDLSQVDEFNKPDFENDSGTVLRAKLENLQRLNAPKKLGMGHYGRFESS